MIGGGLPQDQIAKKFICFGVDGANVFQGTKINVTRQIRDNCAPHWIGVHCMPHHKIYIEFWGLTFGILVEWPTWLGIALRFGDHVAIICDWSCVCCWIFGEELVQRKKLATLCVSKFIFFQFSTCFVYFFLVFRFLCSCKSMNCVFWQGLDKLWFENQKLCF